ncbi:hypothetical protein BJ742DRAFT_808254 [Cladochytrium replicatum]|nr:hypothetical protein BJ742DRAFT_808254 [Cladochytrium replicatum]
MAEWLDSPFKNSSTESKLQAWRSLFPDQHDEDPGPFVDFGDVTQIADGNDRYLGSSLASNNPILDVSSLSFARTPAAPRTVLPFSETTNKANYGNTFSSHQDSSVWRSRKQSFAPRGNITPAAAGRKQLFSTPTSTAISFSISRQSDDSENKRIEGDHDDPFSSTHSLGSKSKGQAFTQQTGTNLSSHLHSPDILVTDDANHIFGNNSNSPQVSKAIVNRAVYPSIANRTERSTTSNPEHLAMLEEDLFGFGKFENVFVTDADLDRAAHKLEDVEKSPQETIRELIDHLTRWKIEQTQSVSGTSFGPLSLCSRFIAIGYGNVTVGENTLFWIGEVVGMHEKQMNNTEQSETEENKFALGFPYQMIGDVKTKEQAGNDPSHVQLSLGDSTFLQIAFGPGTHDQMETCAKAIVDARTAANAKRILRNMELANESNAPMTPWQRFSPIRSPLGMRTENSDTMDAETAADAIRAKYKEHRRMADQRRKRAIALAEEQYSSELSKIDQDENDDLIRLRTAAILQMCSPSVTTECSLCYDAFPEVLLMPCGHSLCTSCLERLSVPERPLQCPWDRSVVKTIATRRK